jgi:hypothetical protein
MALHKDGVMAKMLLNFDKLESVYFVKIRNIKTYLILYFRTGGNGVVELGDVTYKFKNLHLSEIMYAGNYSKLSLPSADIAGGVIYITDDIGGATLAFSNGVNWLRLQYRNIV